MDKITTVIITAFIFLVPIKAQQGDGSSGNPFRGDISTNLTWSAGSFTDDIVYIGTSGSPDLRVVSNGHLTIGAGLTLIFTQPTSDLIITGTGRFSASGSAANKILFTRNSPTNTHWGHISFESMSSEAGSSIIDHCIIEYGDVSSDLLTPNNPKRYGGAIHIDFSNVTVSNSLLRNNKARWGGAIFINDYCNPEIINCEIKDNVATRAGGGIYIWSYSNPSVINCLIHNNSQSPGGELGGGGIFLGAYATDVNIVNSVIVNNSAPSDNDGHNIKFFQNTGTNRPRFTNCIIWDPANSIVYSGQTVRSTDFVNCAIQSPVSGSTTDCFTLNALNTHVAGPNFVATDGTDWSIQPWSPCVDRGINNSSNPLVPLYDYNGNARIGTTDIGAFESQYFRWTGAHSTNPNLWTEGGNWNAGTAPPANFSIFIPKGLSNYPTASTPDYTIGSGKTMLFQPGAKATFGTLSNSGTLRLESDAAAISSLIVGTFTGNNANIEIYLQSGTFTTESGQFNRWHYISSPFTSLAASVFTGTTINLAQWVESSADASLIQGWIAYDGYNYGTGTITGPTFSNLTPGIGYNYYYTSPVTYILSGQINTSNVSRTLYYTDPNLPTQFGLNLTGNPFPSGLDWDAITSDLSFPANTSKVLHYTKDDEHVYYNNGIGSIPGMNGIIPPMQGFFVKTYNETTPALTLSASARVHDNIPQRYKGKQAIPYVRLSLFSGEYYSDNTVVRFDNEAKEGFDYDFDAVKYFISDKKSSVYTFTEGKKYAINGQPFPAETLEMPLHLKMLTAGNLKITLSEIEELDNYRVRLKDNKENITINLKVTPEYSFSSPAGTITDRFTILISDQATNTELPAITETVFRTWHAFGVINIVPDNELWDGLTGSVTITDISGRRISSQGNMEFHRGTPLQVAAPQTSGVYIIEIESGLRRWTGKVAVRK